MSRRSDPGCTRIQYNAVAAGEHDVGLPPRNAAEYAGLFGHAELAVQPGAGHFPWLDDPAWFMRTLAAFLG